MDVSTIKEDMSVYDLAKLMMQGFDRVDKRFDKLERKFDRLERTVRHDHEIRIGNIEDALD